MKKKTKSIKNMKLFGIESHRQVKINFKIQCKKEKEKKINNKYIKHNKKL